MEDQDFNLEQQKKLKEESLHQVAQELRTPLTVIRMHVEAIEDGLFENNDETFLKLKEKFAALELLMDEMTKGKFDSK